MTRKSTEHPEYPHSYVTATLFASCIMFIRVILVAFLIYPPILQTIIFPASVMFLGLSGMALYSFYIAHKEEGKIAVKTENEEKEYESPFQLIPAIQFA